MFTYFLNTTKAWCREHDRISETMKGVHASLGGTCLSLADTQTSSHCGLSPRQQLLGLFVLSSLSSYAAPPLVVASSFGIIESRVNCFTVPSSTQYGGRGSGAPLPA